MTTLFHLAELHPGYKTRFLETPLPNFSLSLALLPCSSTPGALCALSNVLYALEFYCLSSPSNRLGFWVSPVPSLWLFSRYSFVLPPPSVPLLWYILSSSRGKSGTSAEVQKCLHLHSPLFPAVNFQQSRGVWHRPTKKQHPSHRCCLCVSVSSDVISNRQLPLSRKLASGSESRDILIPESLLRNHTCSQQLGPIDSLLPMAA